MKATMLIVLALLLGSCIKKHDRYHITLTCTVYEIPLTGPSRILCNQRVFGAINGDTLKVFYNGTLLRMIRRSIPVEYQHIQSVQSTPSAQHVFAVNEYDELYYITLTKAQAHMFTLYMINVKYKTPSYVFTNNPDFIPCH